MITLPALLGLILCLVNANGGQLFCLTAACELYHHYTLFGYSFYVYGAVGFGIILLLALLSGRKRSKTPTLLAGVLLIGLLLDVVALAWQLLFWPCVSCLVVALLLGGATCGFWYRHPRHCNRALKGVLLFWLVLLIPVVVAASKEVLLEPWTLLGAPDAKTQVFFSPTCPACDSEVTQLLGSPDLPQIAFIPIAKNDADLLLLTLLLDRGPVNAQSLARLFAMQPDEDLSPSLELRWKLTRNKMVLAQKGIKTIPYIHGIGIPRLAPSSDPLLAPQILLGEPAPTGCGVLSPSGVPCD